jgi:hypothetical protein
MSRPHTQGARQSAMADKSVSFRRAPMVEIECVVRDETQRAVAVADGTMERDLAGEREKLFWLPKSRIKIDEETGVIRMPEWLAIDKGLV